MHISTCLTGVMKEAAIAGWAPTVGGRAQLTRCRRHVLGLFSGEGNVKVSSDGFRSHSGAKEDKDLSLLDRDVAIVTTVHCESSLTGH